MENRIHFLSGLPRTGSTLLGSILNQNPNIFVSPTSPLYPLLVNTNESFNLLDLQYTFDKEKISNKIYKDIVKTFYPDDRNKSIVFDKHRGWPRHIEAIKEFIDKDPKIICTVRPIAEIITSYITLADKDPNNFIDKHLKETNCEITNESRAYLLWTQYINTPYENLKIGLENYPENILLIKYDDIIYEPQKTLDKIYSFCEIEEFEHIFDNIENTCSEAKDDAWGLKNLHTIRTKLDKISINPLNVLPQAAIDYFSQFDIRG